MTYRDELHEVITAVPAYVEYRTITENLPEGFMIEQDGKKFRPRYHFDMPSQFQKENVRGWAYFYIGRSTLTFTSFEDAHAFILGWVSFLQWSGFAASTSATEETYEDMLAAQYNERLAGDVIYYTETADQSERVARLLKASRAGVLLADPADPSDQGCWYSFSQVSNIQRGRQYGWK